MNEILETQNNITGFGETWPKSAKSIQAIENNETLRLTKAKVVSAMLYKFWFFGFLKHSSLPN